MWTFALDPVGGAGTRMLIRNGGRVHPEWLDVAYRAAIVPADHVMTRGTFRGLDEPVSPR